MSQREVSCVIMILLLGLLIRTVLLVWLMILVAVIGTRWWLYGAVFNVRGF